MKLVGGQNRNWSDPKSGKARTEAKQSFLAGGTLRQIFFVIAVVVIIGGLFLLFGFLQEGHRTARWIFWSGLILAAVATIGLMIRKRRRRQSLDEALRSRRD